MDTEKIIRELKNVEEEHKNDIPFTTSLNISSMARDCRNKIEELQVELDNKDKQIELYKNVVADMAGELVKYSYSNYFRKNEQRTIDYFEGKWGLKEVKEND